MKTLGFSKFSALLFVAAIFQIFGMTGTASAETAADNYDLYCVQCHGSAGTGKGINAPELAVAPRNHSSATDMGSLSDENIALAIRDGGSAVGKSTQMPAWKSVLSEAEIQDIVKHLRKLCKCEFVKK